MYTNTCSALAGVPPPPDALPDLYFGDAPEKVHWRDNFKKEDSDDDLIPGTPDTTTDGVQAREDRRPAWAGALVKSAAGPATPTPREDGNRGPKARASAAPKASARPTRHITPSTGATRVLPTDDGTNEFVSRDVHEAVEKGVFGKRA